MSDWAGFWIAFAVVFTVDAYVFLQGYDTLFFEHKTLEEKALQKKKLMERAE